MWSQMIKQFVATSTPSQKSKVAEARAKSTSAVAAKAEPFRTSNVVKVVVKFCTKSKAKDNVERFRLVTSKLSARTVFLILCRLTHRMSFVTPYVAPHVVCRTARRVVSRVVRFHVTVARELGAIYVLATPSFGMFSGFSCGAARVLGTLWEHGIWHL